MASKKKRRKAKHKAPATGGPKARALSRVRAMATRDAVAALAARLGVAPSGELAVIVGNAGAADTIESLAAAVVAARGHAGVS